MIPAGSRRCGRDGPARSPPRSRASRRTPSAPLRSTSRQPCRPRAGDERRSNPRRRRRDRDRSEGAVPFRRQLLREAVRRGTLRPSRRRRGRPSHAEVLARTRPCGTHSQRRRTDSRLPIIPVAKHRTPLYERRQPPRSPINPRDCHNGLTWLPASLSVRRRSGNRGRCLRRRRVYDAFATELIARRLSVRRRRWCEWQGSRRAETSAATDGPPTTVTPESCRDGRLRGGA